MSLRLHDFALVTKFLGDVMTISLFQHNEKAYIDAAKMLELTGKAAVIHPTGTGKSFIGFKLCEYNPKKCVCWISPSEYVYHTQLENLKEAGGDVPKNASFIPMRSLPA